MPPPSKFCSTAARRSCPQSGAALHRSRALLLLLLLLLVATATAALLLLLPLVNLLRLRLVVFEQILT